MKMLLASIFLASSLISVPAYSQETNEVIPVNLRPKNSTPLNIKWLEGSDPIAIKYWKSEVDDHIGNDFNFSIDYAEHTLPNKKKLIFTKFASGFACGYSKSSTCPSKVIIDDVVVSEPHVCAHCDGAYIYVNNDGTFLYAYDSDLNASKIALPDSAAKKTELQAKKENSPVITNPGSSSSGGKIELQIVEKPATKHVLNKVYWFDDDIIKRYGKSKPKLYMADQDLPDGRNIKFYRLDYNLNCANEQCNSRILVDDKVVWDGWTCPTDTKFYVDAKATTLYACDHEFAFFHLPKGVTSAAKSYYTDDDRMPLVPVQSYKGELGDGGWDHNDSNMTIISEKGLIIYNDPKSSISGTVKSGTILFKGKPWDVSDANATISGTAYAYKKNCPAASYAVSGRIQNNGTLVLRGKSPIRSKNNCDVIGYTSKSPNATLVFKQFGDL